MSHLPAAAHNLIRRQHGMISSGQLIEAGLARRTIETLVERGDLISGLRGVYRAASCPATELSRCSEICLARPSVALSGPTAGRRWGWRRVSRDLRVHVLSPPASNPAIAPWVVAYRTAALHHELDVIHRDDGIRVTSPARTAFDLARTLDPDDLASVIDQAIAQHGVTEEELVEVAIDWISPRRPWIGRFFDVLGRRLPGGPAESHPEIRVGNGLRMRGVRHLVRQHAIELPGYGPARFDLAVPHLRWAIEVDVHPEHLETLGRAKDELRDAGADLLDWTVSRVSETDYHTRLGARLDELVEVYHSLRSAPMSRTPA